MSAPSNNEFRIAGALGLEASPTDPSTEEVLLQGLGFPLRPISTVPPTDSPNLEDIVATGLPMQWMGNWNSGLFYPKGSFVRDGEWTAVANKLTLDRPSPVPDPDDPATYGITDWIPTAGNPPVTQSNDSVVVSGQTYTFAQGGWIKELLVWATELTSNTSYRIVIVDTTDPDNPVSSVIEEPVLIENDWKIVALLDTVVPIGSVLRISLEALNSGADTNVSGGWRFQGNTPAGNPPATQNWTIDNNRTQFRIDKLDLDGTDRSTELEGVIPESTITAVETENVGNATSMRVTSVVDSGTYMTYGVTLLTETGGGPAAGSVTTIDIDIPIPLPTQYAEQTLQFSTLPSWASSVEGHLTFDGVDQGVPVTNGYGVDILFEPAEVSLDWDIVSFVG